MCITVAKAELHTTKLYAGEAMKDGKYVHVIAYQNQASSHGPNAMILPLPAKGTVTSENVIDTRGFDMFLDNIIRACQRPNMSRSKSFSADSLDERSVSVFEVGSYSVVLSQTPSAVPLALDSVPKHRRPGVSHALLEWFEATYPGWPVALCCWEGSILPEPLLWWYEPKAPTMLFAPALDSHDGNPPKLDAKVRVDHHIAFGSTLTPTPIDDRTGHVRYMDDLPEDIASLLPKKVVGGYVGSYHRNGDFWLNTASLRGPAMRFAPSMKPEDFEVIPVNGWGGR